MADLVQWITAQLDEDERIARAACEYASPEWHLDDEFGETVLWWPPEPHVAENERKHGLRVTADVWRGQTIDASGQQIAPHIATHDPARVLREVEMKRSLVAAHERRPMSKGDTADCAQCWGAVWRCPTLRLLASVYDDRPGYQEAWRP